jgi:hypothetical protein
MITLTAEEEAILRPKYEKYLQRSYKWRWNEGNVMSFDDWWRDRADDAKDRAKYK